MKHYIEEELKRGYTNHSLVLGTTGSGKTHATKIEINRYLNEQKKIFLIDFKNQYEEFKVDENCNQFILHSTNDICLFEFIPITTMLPVPGLDHLSEQTNHYRFEYTMFCLDRRDALLNLFERELSNHEKESILKALIQLFEVYGIKGNCYTPQESFPNLSDFLAVLKKENLALYQEIAHFHECFPARKTTLHFTEVFDYLLFDKENLNQGEKALLYHSVFLHIKRAIQTQSKQSVFIIDGLEDFLIKMPIAEVMLMFMKSTAKKFGTICLFTHQSLTELIKQGGEVILGNSSNVVCFRQAETENEKLKEYFELCEGELERFNHLRAGQAFLFNSNILAKLYIPRSISNPY